MSRWIIVSNRLPFTYNKEKNKLEASSGGLVTAIKGIKQKSPMLWLGFVSNDIPKEVLKSSNADSDFDYEPVFLEDDLYSDYYNGFCNDVLWPMLHYEVEHIKYSDKYWQQYKRVNEVFAQKIIKTAKKDDVIWIHDFHLFLVPKLVKEKKPHLKIGFFLHVPFPSSEIYKQLPCREEIMSSVIQSDLIGFHDYSYLRHFCSSFYAVTGVQSSMLEIEYNGHRTKLGVYPVSIDTQSFYSRARANKTQKIIIDNKLNQTKRKVILGVDRLDYTKGIIQKLMAFKKMLEDNPSLIGKVKLVQVAVPSRTQVPEYINLRKEVERLVGEINGRFSTMSYQPVMYIFKSIDPYELLALYRTSDVLFVTSKRDGMNLVCLEYVATQNESKPGVVLLSEFAGAAAVLSQAILINPMNILDTSTKLFQALSMPQAERKKRHSTMLKFLWDYTATDWARSFTADLSLKKTDQLHKVHNLSFLKVEKQVARHLKNHRSLLMLDYDGTLAAIESKPELAVIKDSVKNLIRKLKNNYEIVIISGRPVSFLKKQFEGLDLYLAGEHGGKFYDYKNKKWRTLVSSSKSTWFKQAMQVIKSYAKRTPNSFIEKKNFGIAWHYRNSSNDFAQFQARRLVEDLNSSLSNLPVSVMYGKKVVEVKSLEANKGYFANWFLQRYVDDENILVMGDDRTDEDMFKVLSDRAITVKIGIPDDTHADYYLKEQSQVADFLAKLL